MPGKSKPITPAEVTKKKQESLPDEVIDAFNELIAEKWDGHYATIYQKDVVGLIKSKMDLDNNAVIYDKHWLDVEEIYRKAGWSVEYDKPGYNESYEASFVFKRKK